MKNPRHNQKIKSLLKIITTPRQKTYEKIHRKCIEITGNQKKTYKNLENQ